MDATWKHVLGSFSLEDGEFVKEARVLRGSVQMSKAVVHIGLCVTSPQLFRACPLNPTLYTLSHSFFPSPTP